MSVATVALGEVAKFLNGGTPSRSIPEYFQGDIPWVTGADIPELTPFVTTARSYITTDAIRSSATNRVPRGTVLLVTRTGVGKAAIAGVDLAFSQDITAILPDEVRLDRNYLLRCLRHEAPRFNALSQGATIRGITREVVEATQIPLPPLQEQRRIAAILDAADALRAARRRALAKLDSLTQAIFVDMFGGSGCAPVNPGPLEAVHPFGWTWVPLLDVAQMATGHTPDRAVPEFWNGDVNWINLKEIRRFDGRWCTETEAKTTPAGVANSSAVILPSGTVCFSRTASIGFVTVMAKPMTTSQDFVNWVCGNDLNPTFLMHALIMARSTLRASSSGSTHKTIYVRDAERFHVLLPPRALQDSFVMKVEGIEVERVQMREDLDRLHTLFTSLQQRAFRGEL